MRRYTWLVYVGITALIATAYFVLPTTSLSKLVLYTGVGLSAVVATVVGVKRNRIGDPRPWRWITGGMASFLAADVLYYFLELTKDEVPFPSPADLLYLGMYPLVIVGLMRMMRQVAPDRDWATLVDAGLVAVATLAVLGVAYMDTYVTDPSMNLEGRLISLAYPVMDIALLAMAARVVGAVHLRQPSMALMALGLSSLLVADIIYGLLSSAGTFETGGFADAFWLGFYVCIGAAALHPASAREMTVRESSAGQITRSRLFVLFLVVLAVPVIDLGWGQPLDKWLTVGASMVMFTLVLLRLMGLMNLVQLNEQKARHDALHDALTGLANRVLFGERVAASVEGDKTGVVSVLFVDLDDFKTINDSLGHQAGDLLLMSVAERLSSCVRGADLVARLSGDEFAILLESAVDRQDAVAVAQRLQDALAEPVVLGGREVLISASVGITVEERTAVEGPEALLRAADVAMYRAKNKGKGRFEFFEEGMHQEAIERLDLKSDLQVALERGQFELHYQPIVSMADKRVKNVEALIRWHHPTRGLVGPDKFIPLAEQTGLIVPIGRWVLREACAQVMRWREQYVNAPAGVSVNLSVRQMHDARLLSDVTDALAESGLEPSSLTVEITESMLNDDAERGARVIEQLKAMKVRVAIDDFGTGYSSLSYLRRFPVDSLKIDRSFVAEMEQSQTSQALVRAVIDLAHVLNLDTVAEGIEDDTQRTVLRDLQCNYGQGFFFSKPLPAAQLEATFEARDARRSGRGAAPLQTLVLTGAASLEDVLPDIATLHADAGVPLMARARWIQTWHGVNPEWEPLTVVVKDQASGKIEAAALLARRLHDGQSEVIGMGHGLAGVTRLPARNVRSARALTKGLVEQLTDTENPWTLELQQLPEGDPVARLLAQQLTRAELGADLWVPRVDLSGREAINDLLTKNMRRQIRKAYNRIETDGHSVEVLFSRSLAEIEILLPKLQQIHVERDHASGRPSDLDDPSNLALWRELILAHAESGQVEVATLRLDDATIGFVIGMIDDDAYRVFDGHFDNEFARYSPGRLVESAVLERAMKDRRFNELDWMAGVAAEKILYSNKSEGRMRLTAASVDAVVRSRSGAVPIAGA
ncbi:MAG: GNAT family N-acetyltransferase [Ilumatobacteraceae bacterium]